MVTSMDFYRLLLNHKSRKLNEILQEGFSRMYYILRILVEKNGETTAGDIASILGVSTPRVAVMLKTLEKKGLVLKKKSCLDGRKTIVKITEKGTKVIEERKDKLFDSLESLLLKLNEEETDNFYFLLDKILS